MGNIKTPTALLLMALMFIGGAPLSAAGGIKSNDICNSFIFVLNAICKKILSLYLIEKYLTNILNYLS